MENTDFTIEAEEKNFHFNVNKNGLVSLSDGNELIKATNFGQEAPAENLDEAKDIAKIMLFAMGKITSF